MDIVVPLTTEISNQIDATVEFEVIGRLFKLRSLQPGRSQQVKLRKIKNLVRLFDPRTVIVRVLIEGQPSGLEFNARDMMEQARIVISWEIIPEHYLPCLIGTKEKTVDLMFRVRFLQKIYWPKRDYFYITKDDEKRKITMRLVKPLERSPEEKAPLVFDPVTHKITRQRPAAGDLRLPVIGDTTATELVQATEAPNLNAGTEESEIHPRDQLHQIETQHDLPMFPGPIRLSFAEKAVCFLIFIMAALPWVLFVLRSLRDSISSNPFSAIVMVFVTLLHLFRNLF